MMNNKIAIITDTHLGCRGSSVFRQYFKNYFENILFPYLDEHDIHEIIHCGDFFDNRTHLHIEDIMYVIKNFVELLTKYNVKMTIIAGNHDVCYKNLNDINALILFSVTDRVKVIVDKPELIEINSQKFLMVPWINNSNLESTTDFIESMSDESNIIVCGHFEIIGAKMDGGAICEHGLDVSIFKKFKEVWSGHFHQKSEYCNVKYLGSLYEMNWGDYNQPRGFSIFDPNDKSLEFVLNDYSLFYQLNYNYSELKNNKDLSLYEDRFIRLVIESEYKKVELLEIQNIIQKGKPISLQIIDKTIIKQKPEESVDSDDEVEDNTQSLSTKDNILNIMKKNNKSDTLIKLMSSILDLAETEMDNGE